MNNKINYTSSSSSTSTKNSSSTTIAFDQSNLTLDPSDILAANELENSDLLKNDDFNFDFDLATKSSLFANSIDLSPPKSTTTTTITIQNNTNKRPSGIYKNIDFIFFVVVLHIFC